MTIVQTITIIEEQVSAGALGGVPAPAAQNSWWAKARCNDGAATMTGLFFSEDPIDIARAKAICSKCAVRDLCLADAVARGEPCGVWGGELLVNGRVVAQKRRRGRPPKQPRPELVVDEVPDPFARSA
jgi:hypothetical protein